MAEAGLDVGALWEPALRHDASGRTVLYVRRRHNRLQSERARRFRECVGDLTRGHRYRGHGPAEDVREARAALTAAARRCSRQV